MTYLILISSILALFLAILVFFKKKRSYSDNILMVWLLFIALHTALEYLQYYNSQHGYPFPWIIGITFSFPAVHPVIIFIYILSYINPHGKRSGALLHLVPVAALNLVLLFTFYLKPGAEKIITYNQALAGTGYDKPVELSTYLVMSVTIAYLIACFWFLKKHIKRVRDQFSNLEGKDMKWLSRLLYSAGIILLIGIFHEISSDYINSLSTGKSASQGIVLPAPPSVGPSVKKQLIPPDIDNTIIYLSLTAGLFYLGLSGIKQTDIFTDLENGEEGSKKAVKPAASIMDPDADSQAVDPAMVNRRKFEQLLLFMEEEKPYLDSMLNLSMLSDKLGYRPHLLSHIINEFGGKNFFDFVNSYRIEEFKQRAGQAAYRNYTLLSIAYDCGFNSKATFNRVFRIYTGQTPSDYFNSLQGS